METTLSKLIIKLLKSLKQRSFPNHDVLKFTIQKPISQFTIFSQVNFTIHDSNFMINDLLQLTRGQTLQDQLTYLNKLLTSNPDKIQ